MIAKEVLNLEGGIGRLSKAFENLNRTSLMAGGFLSAVAGGAILYGLKKITDHAKELSHELVQIQKLGISQAQFDQAKAAAFGLHAQVPGATSVDALKIYGQIYSPLGQENALKMMKPLAEFAQVLGNTTGDYKGATDKVYEMVRAGDLMGKFMNSVTHTVDVAGLQRFLDLGARVVMATHGKVSADTWFQMAQQGGPALSGMTDEGLLTMAIVAQMMKGPRAGTALMSLFQQMRGGIMTQWRAQELKDLGLVGDFHVQRGGHLTWDKGALDTPFTRAFTKDPAAAVQILVDAMKAHGITNQDDQVTKLYSLFQRQTSIREIHDLLRNLPQIQQERVRISGGLGISPSMSLQNAQDYEQVMHNLDASFQEMMMHIAGPLAVAAIPIMNSIGAAFDKIGNFAKVPGNAELIGNIGRGFAILGASLIGGGGLAILAALGPVGWLGIGLTALGIAAVTYKDAILTLVSGKWITAGMKMLTDIQTSITNMLQGIIDWIGKHIPDWIKNNISYSGGGGFGGGGGGGRIINAAWSGGGGGVTSGGGVLAGGSGGGDMMGAVASSAALRQYLATGGHGMNPQTTAWCAAYVGAYLNHHGYASLNTLSATAYMKYGTAETGPVQAGDVVVLGRHGSSPHAGGLGHVGIATGRVSGNRIEMLAGNTGHGVARQWEPLGSAVIRRPPPRHQSVIHNTILLDGEPIHKAVVKRMVRGMTHPTTAPYHDGSRHFTPPDAGLVGV